MIIFLSNLPKFFFVSIVCSFLLCSVDVFCEDFDGDGISDADETKIYHTDPHFADTDGDGINDATEVAFWRKNWNVDADGDGLIALLDYDSDDDGFSDGQEMNSGSNPGNAKSIPIEPPLFSIHELVVGLGYHAEYEGWIDVMGQGYTHERWLQVNWPDFNASGGATRVASGDIDGDGKDEIIIGLGPVEGDPSIPGGVFEVLDDDFKHLAWGEIGWSDYNQTNGESWPGTGNIDGDGKDEIVLGLGSGGQAGFEVFKLTEESILHLNWGGIDWQDYADLYGETHPTAADVDFDGKDEIVVGLGKGADKDGLTDEEEAMLGLFSDSSDTDGDGFSDGVELGYGTDPLNKSSIPGAEDHSAPTAPSGLTLAWDPNTESDLAGYRLYYGSRSGNYEASVDVGNKTTHTFTNLTPEKVYYVAAKDYVAIKVLKVYTAAESGCASGEAICSVTPQVALANGPCKWAVQPQKSSDDSGTWSDIIAFSIN